MAYIDVDFAVPIAILCASIVGVVLVRLAAARGERTAKARTRWLIEKETGMRTDGGASTE